MANSEKNNAQSNARNDEIASCRRHASCLLKLKYRRFTGREWDENTIELIAITRKSVTDAKQAVTGGITGRCSRRGKRRQGRRAPPPPLEIAYLSVNGFVLPVCRFQTGSSAHQLSQARRASECSPWRAPINS